MHDPDGALVAEPAERPLAAVARSGRSVSPSRPRLPPDRQAYRLDFYLLPKIGIREAVVRLCEYNGLSLGLPLYLPGQAGAAGHSAEGGMTEATPAQQVEMIPIDRVIIVNPRVRNRRIFNEIVETVALMGLKRPITVTRRQEGEETFYDLVCGQGRVGACRTHGYEEVPALVVTADQEDCLDSSLVENCARRQHRALDLLDDIGAMSEAIARKTGLCYEYVSGVSGLLRRGEERVLRASNRGNPDQVAVGMADCDDTEIQGAHTIGLRAEPAQGPQARGSPSLGAAPPPTGKGSGWSRETGGRCPRSSS